MTHQFTAVMMLVAVAVLTMSGPAVAQPPVSPTVPALEATGEATITVQPNQAQIEIAVVTRAERSEKTASENAAQVRTVHEKLRDALKESAKIETIGYSLRPDYRHPEKARGEPVISGYTATNVVRVTLDDLTRIGTVIDVATSAGANRIQALRFTVKDEQAATAQALKQAARQARAHADALASALDLQIVRVLKVSEGVPGVVPVRDVMTMATESARMATPIEPAPIDVRASVHLTLEVRPR